ncbi:MAG: hypothetical protein ABGW69_01770 [Nanoarchaeota archaeon]
MKLKNKLLIASLGISLSLSSFLYLRVEEFFDYIRNYSLYQTRTINNRKECENDFTIKRTEIKMKKSVKKSKLEELKELYNFVEKEIKERPKNNGYLLEAWNEKIRGKTKLYFYIGLIHHYTKEFGFREDLPLAILVAEDSPYDRKNSSIRSPFQISYDTIITLLHPYYNIKYGKEFAIKKVKESFNQIFRKVGTNYQNLSQKILYLSKKKRRKEMLNLVKYIHSKIENMKNGEIFLGELYTLYTITQSSILYNKAEYLSRKSLNKVLSNYYGSKKSININVIKDYSIFLLTAIAWNQGDKYMINVARSPTKLEYIIKSYKNPIYLEKLVNSLRLRKKNELLRYLKVVRKFYLDYHSRFKSTFESPINSVVE